jgi:uncharacterized protein YmfQ (DUF2313 family)
VPIRQAALTQATESDRSTLLDNIECLRALLYRVNSLLDSESVEVVIRTETALKAIDDKINRIFAFQHPQNSRDQLERWENEGGKIKYV